MKLLCAGLLVAGTLLRAEPLDRVTEGAGQAAAPEIEIRVRVTHAEPAPDRVLISWRNGGQGLGGDVRKGQFVAGDGASEVTLNAWTRWAPLQDLWQATADWQFPNIIVHAVSETTRSRNRRIPSEALTGVVVAFEFASGGKLLKRFSEMAPDGATVSFAIPPVRSGTNAFEETSVMGLQGLSTHARDRRQWVEQVFAKVQVVPKEFGIVGHLAGYGSGSGHGKGRGTGYGVRHCNREILADECRALHLLGFNGLTGERSLQLAELAGFSNQFKRIYWGGPGSGTPMAFARRGQNACPFDPALRRSVEHRVSLALDEHQRAGAGESWALWDDEIGVYAKEHLQVCSRCAVEYREYLRRRGVTPRDFGHVTWDDVPPYPLFERTGLHSGGGGRDGGNKLAPAPATAAEALNFYYTFRFMTYATAQVFPPAAQQFSQAGIPLYAMQAPTPSWAGGSLDWHEFYDAGANTAIVFETSNRDPQVWQLESYLADLARGISERHRMPFGCLVKPHRGAPLQRMLSVVVRGATVIEWYTYGPDYAKGDSFSQHRHLLRAVGEGNRFLARAESWLYGAKPVRKAEVALVAPRSSEIWGRAGALGVTSLENAKWLYLALRHARVPVDILSEQQVAEGALAGYKVTYLSGTHLRRDAAARLVEWVQRGGSLWTDALGLSRDEANQPHPVNGLLGLDERRSEFWAAVEPYRAIHLKPFVLTNPPALAEAAAVISATGRFAAAVGRELLPETGRVLARFGDGHPALLRLGAGEGDITVAGFWSGLSYSSRVRQTDFDLRRDFDSRLRATIVEPALRRKVYRPVEASEPLVEAVLLQRQGDRSIALLNWAYAGGGAAEHLHTISNLHLSLPGLADAKEVLSLAHGPLPVQNGTVVLPRLEEIDLLVLR